MRRSIIQLSLLLVTMALLPGCSGLSKKFTSEEKVNLEPFATTTIQMVSTIGYGLERSDSILIRPYLSPEDKPELQRLLTLEDELHHVLKGLIAYSLKIVTLSSSNRTEPQKVEDFADYIKNLDKSALDYQVKHGDVTEQEYSDVLDNIRKQENLLEAMRAAQPITQFVVLHVGLLTDEIRQQLIKAENEVEKAIDKDFAREISYVKMLQKRRDTALDALLSIDEYYNGKNNALRRVNESKALLRLGIKRRTVSDSNVKQIEKQLVGELRKNQDQLNLMQSDSEYYMKLHQELDSLVRTHDEEVLKSKSVAQLWSGAHTKMANGITDPAEWFDITDPAGVTINLLTNAIAR